MAQAYINTKDLAAKWNCSEQWISSLCRQGSIKGAHKVGRGWQIPADVEKPEGVLVSKDNINMEAKLPLPVGISDYARAEKYYYYVDKTLLIKELLDDLSAVTLFTRPRRFGKTLTMDMLKVFFEKADTDTSKYFRKRNIWQCGTKYQSLQGKFPVIALSFKDVKFDNWLDTLEKIALVLQAEYSRHREILASKKLSAFDKNYFKSILSCSASKVALTEALGRLTAMLSEVYNTKVVVIIDEYDTPIQQGFSKGFYEDVLSFMRLLFSAGLKDNNHLFKGVLTGILRISKENLFSGLNNPTIDTVLDKAYSSYFGFTQAEVEAMAVYYEQEAKLPELRAWYDGYKFGDTEIYNPWSVTNYFSKKCEPAPYWANTSENGIIKELLLDITTDKAYELTALLNDDKVLTRVNLNVIYPKLHDTQDAIYSFLLMAGYLKAIEVVDIGYYYMALPNLEIKDIYRQEILTWIDHTYAHNIADNLRKALLMQDSALMEKSLNAFLQAVISWHDASTEGFYHGMMLGLTATLADKYSIRSNRESGFGRFDLQLKPKNKHLPGIIMEFKAVKATDALAMAAQSALQQIKGKAYATELADNAVEKIIHYGIAFCGKTAKILVE